MILFAVGIAVTIALHEAGHMLAARAFGMRVRRYFIGFGPTVVSKKVGQTEYGVAALPFGGFCEIAGMTAQDEVTPEEAPHAMVNKPWWQRVVVLAGGIIVNLLLGLAVIYGVALTSGLPNPHADTTPVVGEVLPGGTAQAAGIEVGDRITAVDGQRVATFPQLAQVISQKPGQQVTLTVDGAPVSVTVGPQGTVGVVSAPIKDAVKKYGPVEGISATAEFAGRGLSQTVKGLASLPAKVPGVVASIFGAERADDSPMSVVGASRVGGELASHSIWDGFWLMLASLNFFLALFNLIPLPPLDGGHIAVVLYEKLTRRRTPVDYTKLMPITYVAAGLMLGLGLVTIVADVVNPVQLFN
ncbi:site-2 protease family protein [Corynebacterium tapiri]|uniref:Zinc metalloprotease Rip1 n=2 Tax=Corynebacterium tapiri TaxID=1448266 RepID=A0A5C4U6R4_9CORY|nr:site-2 protease family protein [Corynebacterium tapiri]